MKTAQILDVLDAHRSPGDAVYSVMREKRMGLGSHLMDVLFNTSILNDGRDLFDNVSAQYYLIGTEAEARIVRVRHGQVDEVIDVRDWDGRPEDVREVTVGGHDYRTTGRLA